jgi:hypothetical protein
MLIALLLTLCPFLAVPYMIRCLTSDARAWIRKEDSKRAIAAIVAEQKRLAAAEAPPVDDRPVYHVVEFEPSLVAMMKRDGFA